MGGLLLKAMVAIAESVTIRNQLKPTIRVLTQTRLTRAELTLQK